MFFDDAHTAFCACIERVRVCSARLHRNVMVLAESLKICACGEFTGSIKPNAVNFDACQSHELMNKIFRLCTAGSG